MESEPAKLNNHNPEHLTPGAKPIITCLISSEEYDELGKAYQRDAYGKLLRNDTNGALSIDILDDEDSIEGKRFLSGGKYSYVISTIDNKNKFSEQFIDCTGLVVSGIYKNTGKNISFLTHQNPSRFLREAKESFLGDLERQLRQIVDQCEPGTIDAVLIGGKFVGHTEGQAAFMQKTYLDSIDLVSSKVKEVLGFGPNIINGPKNVENMDAVYFDNENRRLYFIRPRVNPKTGAFVNSGIEEAKKEWEIS